MARTAALLVIGNEILSGKVQDANTLALARELRGLGVELRRVLVVPDEVPVIADELRALRGAHSMVFTSGGVGPTHDDVTIAAVARSFDRAVVHSEEIAALLRAHYGPRLTDEHLRMARVVEGTELVHDAEGVRWPAFVVENVYILPGIPELFRAKLATLRGRLRGAEAGFVLRSVYARGDEGSVTHLIDAVAKAFPDVLIGSYPSFGAGAHSLRVTFDAHDDARVRAAAEAFAASLPSALFDRIE